MRSVATGQKEKPHRLGSQTVGFFSTLLTQLAGLVRIIGRAGKHKGFLLNQTER